MRFRTLENNEKLTYFRFRSGVIQIVGGDGIWSDAEHIALHVLHFFGSYLTDVRTIVSVEQGTELFFTLEPRGVHQHVAHT